DRGRLRRGLGGGWEWGGEPALACGVRARLTEAGLASIAAAHDDDRPQRIVATPPRPRGTGARSRVIVTRAAGVGSAAHLRPPRHDRAPAASRIGARPCTSILLSRFIAPSAWPLQLRAASGT